MKLKIIKGINEIGRDILEIQTNNAKIAVCFGEEKGTGYTCENNNPNLIGLTTGRPEYDGIFILRNPENCNLIKYALDEVPIYMEKKLENNYETCMDFYELDKKKNIKNLIEAIPNRIKNLEVTSFIIDPSNFNTHIMKFKDELGKSIVICGDFRDYDEKFEINKLKEALSVLCQADYIFIEGKYFGKTGLDYNSSKELFEKLKNIVKLYKQVFVIQSETDMIMASTMYKVAMKTRRIFIEDTFLCNLTTLSNGSAPTPFGNKKVYSYNPLFLEIKDFPFKKKYVAPFYINSAIKKLKKEKYVMNITKNMIQDIQIFYKDDSFYDACVILAEFKGIVEKDEELSEFIKMLKEYNMDYYEIYTYGQINIDVLKQIVEKLRPKYVVPLENNNDKSIFDEFNNIKILRRDEEIII